VGSLMEHSDRSFREEKANREAETREPIYTELVRERGVL